VPGSEAPTGAESGAATAAGSTLDVTGHSPINIRNISIKCGRCDTYQTLAKFERRGEWNVYTYECENGVCDPAMTRTLIEVPVALDEFANRDPNWRGGKRHAGSGDHHHG
jgi:hypothetical protein